MIYQQLGYLMRSGSPDSLDLMVAMNYAVMAADLALEGASGRLVALRNGNYTSVPITVLGQGVNRVDVDALYDVTSTCRRSATWPASRCSCTESPMVIGVLTAGGDCPGLNAVVRAVVSRATVTHDMEVVGIQNGWDGLMDDHVRPLDRECVEGSCSGAARSSARHAATRTSTATATPAWPHDRGERVRRPDRHRRRRHAADCARAPGGVPPVVGVPKTIDNDIAGTDRPSGSTRRCRSRPRRSTASRRRPRRTAGVLVVELMGRPAGWIALYAGIAAGVDAILLPERETDLDQSLRQIRSPPPARADLLDRRGRRGLRVDGRAGRQSGIDAFGFVRLGGIADAFGAELERQTGFETRVTVLGHLQRGGTPTAFDRYLATRFGVGRSTSPPRAGSARWPPCAVPRSSASRLRRPAPRCAASTRRCSTSPRRSSDSAPVGAPRLVAIDLDGTLLRSDQTVSRSLEGGHRRRAVGRHRGGRGDRTLASQHTGPGRRSRHRRPRDLRQRGDRLRPRRRVHRQAHAAAGGDRPSPGARAARAIPGHRFRLGDRAPLRQRARLRGAAERGLVATAGGLLRALRPGRVGPADDEAARTAAVGRPRAPGARGDGARRARRASTTLAGNAFVELAAPGIGKEVALERLAADLGLGAPEVVAFGDHRTDAGMIAWAGHGVAVANAHPAALAAADEVTASNDDDGVAIVLERLLGGSQSR